jgi:hypothetical protein
MARRLLADWDGETRTLVVAGRLHTALEPHRHGWPMGHHLARRLPGLASVRLEPLSGSITNLGVKRVGARRPPRDAAPRLRVGSGELVLDLPRATPAVVPSGRL